MSKSDAKYIGSIAKNVNDSIKTNETSLTHLEDQINRLTEVLVAVNGSGDSVEEQSMDDDRKKLRKELNSKTELLNKTLKALENELLEQYNRIDTLETETERLEWELSKAEEKYKLQNENLIDQNSALMSALQEEQNRSRDVIEDLERELQTVVINDSFERNIEQLTTSDFQPNQQSSPIKDHGKTALETVKLFKSHIIENLSEEDSKIMEQLEKSILRETAIIRKLQKRCKDLKIEIEKMNEDRPTKQEYREVAKELGNLQEKFKSSDDKATGLEKALITSLSKHETAVDELNQTISQQDLHIEELKKKNFYPKIIDDLKKENAQLKNEVKKLNGLIRDSPSRKVGSLKDKFEKQAAGKGSEEKSKTESEEQRKVMDRIQTLHKEEVNHLKSKLSILEKKLNQSMEENAALTQELNDAMDQLDENSFNYEFVLQDLQSKLDSTVNSEPVTEELAELRKTLESERLKNLTLSRQLVELERPESLPPPPPPISDSKPASPNISIASPVTSSSRKNSPLPISPKPNTIKVMTDKISGLRKDKEYAERRMKEVEEGCLDLQKRIFELEELVESQKKEIRKLEIDVRRGVTVSVSPIPHEELDQLEKELETSIQDNQHLEETLNILSDEHNVQIDELKDEIKRLKSMKYNEHDLSLDNQLAAERKLRVELENKIEDLEFQLNEFAAARESEESLDELQSNLEEAEKMCEKLMTVDKVPALEKYENRLKEKDSMIEKLKKEVEELQTEIEHLNKEFADISTEIAEADNQYGQRIENLQKQLESQEDDHQLLTEQLQDEITFLKNELETERENDAMQKLEEENAYLTEECKTLTDRLASDIISKGPPSGDVIQVIDEMKEHYNKAHDRLKVELGLRNQKIDDLKDDIVRISKNHERKLASVQDEHNIKGERLQLKIEEHKLEAESVKKELDQMNRISKRFEDQLESKNKEFNEVVTKLLNLENLIEIQKDRLLAKDEEISNINRQLANLRADLDITEQRQSMLREESIALDVLETSLNEVSEHDRLQEQRIKRLEKRLEESLSDLAATTEEREKLSGVVQQLSSVIRKELPSASAESLEKKLETKDRALNEKNNEINRILNTQDKTKLELVSKNVELEKKYDVLMEKMCDIEDEKSSLLEEIDTNFKSHTETVKELEAKIKDLKTIISEKDNIIFEKDERFNELNANNLLENQNFFKKKKELEKKVTHLKTRLLDFEGGETVKRSASISSGWLEDTAMLNQVIGEKDRQIRDLRDSLKRSSAASSLRSSCIDLDTTSSMPSIPPPPTERELEACLGENTSLIEDYKTKVQKLQSVIKNKDNEYDKLLDKFKQELISQNSDNKVYNDHIAKLQKLLNRYKKYSDYITSENTNIVEKSSKGLCDANQSLNDLNTELQQENDRTSDVLSELDILKEEMDQIQQAIADSDTITDNKHASAMMEKLVTIEESITMMIEEHQCSLDHYQLILQTTQEEMNMATEELTSTGKIDTPTAEDMVDMLQILQEKVTLLSDTLCETRDDVRVSQFRGCQNGKSEKENTLVVEQAQIKYNRFDDELTTIKEMLDSCSKDPESPGFIKITEDLLEISNEMGDLKDLLSLKHDLEKSQELTHEKSEVYQENRTMTEQSVLECDVSLKEIDGLELITHELRHQLREKIKECDFLQKENENMAQSMKDLQRAYSKMLSVKTVELDALNDTMTTEKHSLETQLTQLSEVLDYRDKSHDKLQKSLSFEQGRVQQLKEDLDSTYEKTFEHIKEYEGRVSTMSERLNLQQKQIKAKLEKYEQLINALKHRNREYKRLIKEKTDSMDEIQTNYKIEMKSKERALRKAHSDLSLRTGELEDLKSTVNLSKGSFNEQLTIYGDIMTKFKSEISEEKEAFQNSLAKLKYLVEDRTQKVKEYEGIVAELQDSLAFTRNELKEKSSLNSTLLKERNKLKHSMSRSQLEGHTEADSLKHRALQAEKKVEMLKSDMEDLRYKYEIQLSNKADEILKVKMKLEQVDSELKAKGEENNKVSNELRFMKLEMESARSDNQLKDLQQRLKDKQEEADVAVSKMRRAEKECKVLKDLLIAVQDNPDSKSLVEKISDYETTIADYEVQVTMLKKNISDLHTQLHSTCNERQRVIEKAQEEIVAYQRRLDQMSSRVDEAKSHAKKESESYKESKRSYQNKICLLEKQLKEAKQLDNNALRKRIQHLEKQLTGNKSTAVDKDIHQKFEMAVKRADHLQLQVDMMRKTNKKMQKTVEELWEENTQLLKDLNKTKVGEEAGTSNSSSLTRKTREISDDDALNAVGTADI